MIGCNQSWGIVAISWSLMTIGCQAAPDEVELGVTTPIESPDDLQVSVSGKWIIDND